MTPLTRADLERFEALAKKCIREYDAGVVVEHGNDAIALAAAMPAAIAALREAVELLRGIEWKGRHHYEYEDSAIACPVCNGWKPRDNPSAHLDTPPCWCERCDATRYGTVVGHAPDCALAAMLKRFA